MNVRRLAACLGVALGLALAGCASTPAPVPSKTASVPDKASNDINPQSRDRVRDGGLLRFSLTALPTQWNPHHQTASQDTKAALAPLMPFHFSLDAAGRPTPNPAFIASVDADVDAEQRTRVTLHLNPLARWGDGRQITAADWAATWRAATGRVAGVTLVGLPGWERVTDVSPGQSPTDVVITYRSTDLDWAEPLVRGPLRGDALTDATTANWTSPDPAHYAAPFRVAHVDTTQGVLTLERNSQWWGATPKLDRIMFRIVQPEAVAAAFQHNELDVWPLTSTDTLQQSSAAADTTLRTAPGNQGRLLRMSTTGVLADDKVRHAIIQAMDRGKLAASQNTGSGDATAWSNLLLLPTQPGYMDEARATGFYFDIATANDAFAKLGWVTNATTGLRSKGGQLLTLTYGLNASDEIAAHEYNALKGQLAAAGVTLSAVPGTGDLTPSTVTMSPFPLAHLPASVQRPALRELADKVRSEPDPVRRADQASQLARTLWKDAIDVPLYQLPQQVAVRNGLANYGAPAYSTISWEDVGWST